VRKGAGAENFLRQQNERSNAQFFYTNRGVLFNSGLGNTEGLFWPRGSGNSYIFGQGLWFAARKRVKGSVEEEEGFSSAGLVSPKVFRVLPDIVSRSFILASVGTNSPSGLFIRSDTSMAWTQITLSPPESWGSIKGLMVLPSKRLLVVGSGGIYAGPFQGVWSSANNVMRLSGITAMSNFGAVLSTSYLCLPNATLTSWTRGIRFTASKMVSSLSGNRVVAVATSNKIYCSLDGGNHWDTLVPPYPMIGMEFASDTSIVVGTPSNGIYQMPYHGSTWLSRSEGIDSLNILRLRTDDQIHFVIITGSGIYSRSIDSFSSGNWKKLAPGLSWTNKAQDVAIDSGGSIHIVDSAGRLFTQWQSIAFIPGLKQLCEVGYNPNTNLGWYVEGEHNPVSDGADPAAKNISYVGPRYDPITGIFIPGSSPVVAPPYYSWPVWDTAGGKTLKHNFYFGDYISDVTKRSTDVLRKNGSMARPAMISEEDIFNHYTDRDTSLNPEFKTNSGYPLGLDIAEYVYSWSFGRYRDMVLVRYRITNASNETLRDCWIAPALDPDLASSDDLTFDHNAFVDSSLVALKGDPSMLAQLREPYRSHPELLNMGAQWHNHLVKWKEYGVLGLSFLESPVVDDAGNAVAIDDSIAIRGYGPSSLFQRKSSGLVTFRKWRINNDPSTEDLRYDFVSSGGRNGDDGVEADLRILMATGPFMLPPGKTTEATVVLTFARESDTDPKKNFSALLLQTDFAHQLFGEVDSANVGGEMRYFVNNFQVTGSGSVGPLAMKNDDPIRCYPDPFASDATIAFDMKEAGSVHIELMDLLGKPVRTVYSGYLNSGKHEMPLRADALPAGTYQIRLSESGDVRNIRIVHIP